eukprot:1142213-Pelagomonas_calceolata.AAC.1
MSRHSMFWTVSWGALAACLSASAHFCKCCLFLLSASLERECPTVATLLGLREQEWSSVLVGSKFTYS